MNSTFSFNQWFASVLPSFLESERLAVRKWLIDNDFKTIEALSALEKADMPTVWSSGRKAALFASKPIYVAQGML